MNSKLIETLRQMVPTGSEGFEGLVAKLLTALTGRRFYLAKPGSQAGRDLSMRYADSNVVAVECKRYGLDTELDERELLGELVQAARNIPDLDLWILVVSRDIPSQLQEALHRQACHDGLEFLSISTDGEKPDSLETLCAQAPEIVLAHLEPEISLTEKADLQRLFEEIAASPKFGEKVEQLKEEFLSPFIGYDNWRSGQNRWFESRLASEAESRAHFGQLLNIREPGVALVRRESAWAKLDEWFSSWSETQEACALLGEEGDGKTWSAASWLSERIQGAEDFPAVIFLSSLKVESNDPLTLLSTAIFRRLRTLRLEDWERRLYRWSGRSAANNPRILLVLDGINERRQATWWRALLEALASAPWRDSVAVLVTCRTNYWRMHFENLRHLRRVTHALPPYDDKELDVALTHHNLSRSDVPDNLLPLIRKPRYFDLMIKYRGRIAESGDVTVTRLIYEDWRDRLQRKAHLELDDDTFQGLIRELASEYLEGQECVKERDLDALLPSYLDKQAIVDELRTGGILRGKAGRYQVDERMLVHGFGLLLIDQLEKESAASERDLGEAIAEWLEPQAEMDIKADICEFAALHALSLPELPRKAKVALLNTWIGSHNPGEQTTANFTAYFPIDPLCYTELAEVVWSDMSENPWAQELLMHTFLRWHDFAQVTSQLRSVFERWLGFVHLYGVSYQRGKTREDAERLRQEICDRAGFDLQPGPFMFAARLLTATQDDGLLQLGRAALAVLSYIPRGPFVQAIATGCVAEAIMGEPAKYDLFKWVMSTASQSVWADVKQEVKQLLETDHLVAKQAAYRLLSFEGSEAAHKLQQTLPNDLFPPSRLREAHKRDPCTSLFAWSQEVCESCLQREDLPPQYIVRRSKHQCVNPDLSIPTDLGTRLEPLAESINLDSVWSLMGPTGEDITLEEYEPALCAYAPYAMAGLVRRIVRQADQRKGFALRQLAWRLIEHCLIFGEEETEGIYRAWGSLHEIPIWGKTEESAEYFLFGPVLKGLDAQKQFEHLLTRPDKASDLTTYEPSFLPIVGDWEFVWNELASPQDTKRRQRALWFLSAHPDAIPRDSVFENLAPFLSHEDSLVRSSILKISYFVKDERLINAFIEDEWTWNKSFCDRENHWGNLLLCEHGESLTYSELRNRVHPTYLGYALKCRGMKDGELNQYAEDVHRVWSRIGTDVSDLPSDFPLTYMEASEDVTERTRLRLSPSTYSRSITFISREFSWGGVSRDDLPDVFQSWESRSEEIQNLVQIARQAVEEQIEAGNHWFASHFCTDALEQILDKRPDLAAKWLESAYADTDSAPRLIHLARSFYDALCSVLLQYAPDEGSRLYWRLYNVGGGITVRDARSKIQLLDYALFRAPVTDNIEATWKRGLEQCTTDQELMQIAIVAQCGNRRDWLRSYIHQRVQSPSPLEKSRALTLLGFMETEEDLELLGKLLETEPDTWIKDLLRTSLGRWQANAWAKHWFRRFLAIDDDVAAWAAFRLFLQCVDSRFWLWQEMIQSEVGNSTQLTKRLVFQEDNSGTIENRIRENEKPLREHLFGQKVMPNQAWPWM